MSRKAPVISSEVQRGLSRLGRNVRYARLRRQITAELLAREGRMSRPTLSKIEKGDPNVSMGAYWAILNLLDLDSVLLRAATEDFFVGGIEDEDEERKPGKRKRVRRKRRSPDAEKALLLPRDHRERKTRRQEEYLANHPEEAKRGVAYGAEIKVISIPDLDD